MNFIKRVGSFAWNSWRDFSDYNDQSPLNDQDESKNQEFDPIEVARSVAVYNDDDDFVRRKSTQGFFRKRFSKKKLVVLDDPRSPSTQFQRTPLQLNNTVDSLGEVIVSPFDVQDMLETIETAVDVTPKKALHTMPNLIEVAVNGNNKEELTNEIWKEFDYKERVLTDSMIVEVSSFEIQNNATTNSNDNVVVVEEANTIADDQVDETAVVTEQKVTPNNEHSNEEEVIVGSCKVVGIVSKKEESSGVTKTLDSFIVTSTPKKSAIKDVVESNIKKAPRTPLMAICNSPSIKTNSIKFDPNVAKKSELSKKKKLNSAKLSNRKLPKAPSTPMTPLFKNKQKCIVSEFDKENF